MPVSIAQMTDYSDFPPGFSVITSRTGHNWNGIVSLRGSHDSSYSHRADVMPVKRKNYGYRVIITGCARLEAREFESTCALTGVTFATFLTLGMLALCHSSAT